MKFAFAAAIISAVSAASLPYCPLPEPAQPAAPAPAASSAAPAPAASSAAPAPPASGDFAVGDVVGILTIHSGSDVQNQAVGINTDNKLGIHATSGDNVSYVLQKGSSDNTFQVQIQDSDKFLVVNRGYLETQSTSGMDWTIDGSSLVLNTAGNRGFVVCPSDGNTLKYSTDNCADPVGVALHLVKAA